MSQICNILYRSEKKFTDRWRSIGQPEQRIDCFIQKVLTIRNLQIGTKFILFRLMRRPKRHFEEESVLAKIDRMHTSDGKTDCNLPWNIFNFSLQELMFTLFYRSQKCGIYKLPKTGRKRSIKLKRDESAFELKLKLTTMTRKWNPEAATNKYNCKLLGRYRRSVRCFKIHCIWTLCNRTDSLRSKRWDPNFWYHHSVMNMIASKQWWRADCLCNTYANTSPCCTEQRIHLMNLVWKFYTLLQRVIWFKLGIIQWFHFIYSNIQFILSVLNCSFGYFFCNVPLNSNSSLWSRGWSR